MSELSTAELAEVLAKIVINEINKTFQEPNHSLSAPPPPPPPRPTTTTTTPVSLESIANDYIDFTYKNPTIYHVVNHFKTKLQSHGFTYLDESSNWSSLTSKPGKYFTIRNGTSIVAFKFSKDWKPHKGIGIIGSHIDALTAILKPNSTKADVEGYELLGVAPYGGTLGDVWWDRDLGIGGRLLVKKKDGKVEQVLVDSSPAPIAHIPTLAPHFGTPAVGPFNKETQAVPVIGFHGDGEEDGPSEEEKKAPLYGKHSLKLLRYIARLAGVEVWDILQWDLQLYDVQKGTIGGLNNEFIFAPRVDDRVCSYAAMNALIESADEGSLADDSFSIVALVDHEEIGSATRSGIKGGLIEMVVSRIIDSRFSDERDIQELLRLTYANTIILSADVIHLVNPNFTSVYLDHHKPVPNKGVTISLDPNGHMATDSVGLAFVEELARRNDDQLQYFQIRNDSRSGGTIGPSISLQTGARTIDLGIPQLSMHSIRAALGSKDVGLGLRFFKGFFKNWRKTYDEYSGL
ncbi:uncharacterized protein J8A68_000009 [[Candida] subhashii]|uniref:Vacuolar aminopeptidase 1 n=1 Tax=[Candida] subhashii TaxID=561895 RepID=A0A8J5R825_9ASCO|nr:uncharacterized protein J8A68_000009 [[Candida] subhashii]KAG7666445.1 hypothetical protein J8A68_000009 [[Candida] subhashii]